MFNKKPKEKYVKCFVCKCLLEKEDAQRVKVKDDDNTFEYDPFYFCGSHTKPYDLVEYTKNQKEPFLYRHIPARFQRVDKKGKYV